MKGGVIYEEVIRICCSFFRLMPTFAADLAITGVKVFPSPDAAPVTNATVLIHDGKISAVGKNVAIPPDATKLTCSGCFVFAGFWNSHVHFTEPKWAAAATAPAPVLTRNLQAMLTHSGFTTVVDLASDIRSTSALRRRIDSGEVPGPRIFTAGSGIYPPHGVPILSQQSAAGSSRRPSAAFHTGRGRGHRQTKHRRPAPTFSNSSPART